MTDSAQLRPLLKRSYDLFSRSAPDCMNFLPPPKNFIRKLVVLYVAGGRVSNFPRESRQIPGRGGKRHSGQVSRYSERVPFLVLDDISVEKATDWARQSLDVIFYQRDAHRLATVITPDISPKEISTKIHARIASRVAGMGKIIRVIGPDCRRPRKKGER